MGRKRREANRPLTAKQREALRGLVDQVERVRFDSTGGMPERKEQDSCNSN